MFNNSNLFILFVFKSDGVFGSDLNKKKVKSPVEKSTFLKNSESVSWRPKLKAFKRPSPKETKMSPELNGNHLNDEQLLAVSKFVLYSNPFFHDGEL